MWPHRDHHRPFGLEDIVTNLLARVINRIDGIDKADKRDVSKRNLYVFEAIDNLLANF